jgi:CDP-4-dehydro-6-deoxyglucose reductase, E3
MERPGYQARVERIFDHCPHTRSLFLRMASTPMPAFLPGMFISVAIPLADGLRVRPYTLASSPEEGEPFELCFNLVPNGPGVAWMFDRKEGDLLNFTGPFGAFILERPPEDDVVFIAEGTAIAPIRPMLRRALAKPGVQQLQLLYFADDVEHLLYRAELELIASKHPRFDFDPHVIDAPREVLYGQILQQVQRRWVDAGSVRSRHFFVCGVGSGVLAIRDLLRRAGYERRSVRYEQW